MFFFFRVDIFQVVGSWQKKPLKTEECPTKRISVGNTSSNHWFSENMLVFRGVFSIFGFWANLSGGSTKCMPGYWTKRHCRMNSWLWVVLDYTPETTTSNQNRKHYTQDKQLCHLRRFLESIRHYLIMPSICIVSMFPIMFLLSFFPKWDEQLDDFLGYNFYPMCLCGNVRDVAIHNGFLSDECLMVVPNQLMVNWWFGARWFGIRIGIPLS